MPRDITAHADVVKHTVVEITDVALKPLATLKVNAGGLTGLLGIDRAVPLDLDILTNALDLTHPNIQ